MKEIFTKTGDSIALYIISMVNAVVYITWMVMYIVCLILREISIDRACDTMLGSGYTQFTVEVTSPLFGVLELFAKALPVILVVWLFLFFYNDRKRKELCSEKLIAGVFIIDLISALAITLDVFALHMVLVK